MRYRFLLAFLGAFISLLCVSTGFASNNLVVSDGIADYVAIPMFEEEHKDIHITIDTISPLYTDLADRFLTEDDQFDLYRLNSNLGIQQHLRAKGYFYDLSQNDGIQSFVNSLAPIFQSQVRIEDEVFGVPSFFVLEYPIRINPDIAEEIGLQKEDMPKNLLDLLRFVNSWNDTFGDDFPEYYPFSAIEASSYALMHYNPYIGIVLEMYKDTMVAQGNPLRYDTPLFYELLTEIEPWTFEERTSVNYWQEQMPTHSKCLFYSGQMFGDAIFTQLCGNDTLVNMPLAEGATSVQAYELECVVVNPATQHPDWAVELASYYVKDCKPELLRILCPGITEPYISPDYEENMRGLQSVIDQEKEALALAPPDEQREREEQILFLENMLQEQVDNPYSITIEAMNEYRAKIAPYLIPRGEGVYESELVYADTMTYAMQWLEGAISMKEFAKKLDAFLFTVEAEMM